DEEGWTTSLRSRNLSHSKVQSCCPRIQSIANNTNGLANTVTIVTMYINIGTFQKGETNSYFTPELYQRWMKVFAFLQNPVVAFFDNEEDMKYFENLRHRLGANHTKVILVKRSQLWSFSLRHGIRNIFNQPGYPKHHPNTVIPEYSCVMHAKYEFMRIATELNCGIHGGLSTNDIAQLKRGHIQECCMGIWGIFYRGEISHDQMDK
ncbi:hypothetical protein LSH36_256g06054, partial [Paralvinella palmiformis]